MNNKFDTTLILVISLIASLIASAAVVVGWLLTDTNGKIAELRIEMNTQNANTRNEINNTIDELRIDVRHLRMTTEADTDKNRERLTAHLIDHAAPEAPEAK